LFHQILEFGGRRPSPSLVQFARFWPGSADRLEACPGSSGWTTNVDVRDVIQLALDQPGHDVVDSVGSGQAALEQLAQHPYDLVLCDLHMPEVDGRALYRVIARRPPPGPAFLFVTGYPHGRPYAEFLRAAQVPVLAEPFAISVLRGSVRRLLSRP